MSGFFADVGKHEREDGKPFRNFYGKRVGRRLRPGQRTCLKEDLPGLNPLATLSAEDGETACLDLTALFGGNCAVWLEIGFGSGEHLMHQAALNPNVGIIGSEPYLNGVASLLRKLRLQPMENVRVVPEDVRRLFDVLAPGSVERVFLLYPDPWPKKRHHRRRFANPEYLQPLARIMKPQAELRIATDIADYARQAVEQLHQMPEFAWRVQSPADWRQPWSDWRSTRYERKALKAGRRPFYLTFERSR
ncbi:MAG: tRNA (guanosine(46)-N7)-methyltransferase TrmB [Rhodobacteraceae bacterium]|nr:tRNA (guanosine(46)-N7)-methyltransferase TrmB [Paracoccaceae bacterium]